MARQEIKINQQPELIISESTQEAWDISGRIPYKPSKHAKKIIAIAEKRRLRGSKPNLIALEPSIKQEFDWILDNTSQEDWEEVPEFKPASTLVHFGPKPKAISLFNYFMDKQVDAYMNSQALRNGYYQGYISTVKCKKCGQTIDAWPSCFQKDYLVDFPWCLICRFNKIATEEFEEINKGIAVLEEQANIIRKTLSEKTKKCRYCFNVIKKNQ